MSEALIHVRMFTGCCECDGEDVFLGRAYLGSEYNLMLAEELAFINAENHGEDGWYVCCKCWERQNNCECEDPDLTWEINPDIDFSIAFYDPDKHGEHFLNNFPTAQKHEKGYYFVDLLN